MQMRHERQIVGGLEGSLQLRPHAQGVWDFKEKQQTGAAGRDPEPPSPDRRRLGWTPRGLPWTWGAAEAEGTGGQRGTALLENTLMAPESRPQMPQVSCVRLAWNKLPLAAALASLKLPGWPRARPPPSSNLCLLICETGVTTPSVYASQGCKDHMRKFWSPQRLCFFLFSGDHPGQPTPPPPGSRHPYLAPQAPILPETSR